MYFRTALNIVLSSYIALCAVHVTHYSITYINDVYAGTASHYYIQQVLFDYACWFRLL